MQRIPRSHIVLDLSHFNRLGSVLLSCSVNTSLAYPVPRRSEANNATLSIIGANHAAI
jgi:hypothetical protein